MNEEESNPILIQMSGITIKNLPMPLLQPTLKLQDNLNTNGKIRTTRAHPVKFNYKGLLRKFNILILKVDMKLVTYFISSLNIKIKTSFKIKVLVSYTRLLNI